MPKKKRRAMPPHLHQNQAMQAENERTQFSPAASECQLPENLKPRHSPTSIAYIVAFAFFFIAAVVWLTISRDRDVKTETGASTGDSTTIVRGVSTTNP